MRFTLPILLCALAITAAPARTFTNAAGKELEAEIVGATDTQVILRMANRKTATIKIETLSEPDRKFIEEWRATQIPRLRFTPQMVRSNRDARPGKAGEGNSSSKVQNRSLNVNVVNEEGAKGLEDSTMRLIVIGRSVAERSSYKVLSIQDVDFSVPAGGKATVPFKKVINYYEDGDSRRGYKIVGYALHAKRKSDQRELYTHASMKQIQDAIPSIVGLQVGDVTDGTFRKQEVVQAAAPGEGGSVIQPRPDPENVMPVE